MANEFQAVHSTIKWVLEKVEEFEKEHSQLVGQNRVLEKTVKSFEKVNSDLVTQNTVLKAEVNGLEKVHVDLVAQNHTLQTRVDELAQMKDVMDHQVGALQEKSEQLQNLVDHLQGSKAVEPTHRNILYSEEKRQKRLPVLKAPMRWADEVGSLVFGECFAVSCQHVDGQDLWLRLRGGDFPEHWVLGCDAGTINCVDMTKYDREKYCTRIQSCEYRGQHFPKKMCTEGFAGSSDSDTCLVSASGDSFWREVNIELLFRGIAAATVFEEGWGGDETFMDWVAYYAVNCVQYGQLRTPLQKHLKVTVKPTGRWRDYQVGRCLGPDLDSIRDDIGKAQYKECCWLRGMEEQLHVKWEGVEFLTAFSFLRAHCAWTLDDCREAANDQFMWVLQEFFAGRRDDKALCELECAHWLWDEAFDGCSFDESARARAYAVLQRVAKCGARLDLPRHFRTGSAAPLAWGLMAPALSRASAGLSTGLSAGGLHCLALDAAGTLRCWGSNQETQCSAPALAPGEHWAAVSAGEFHSTGLTDTGVLRAWGSNAFGQCSAPALGHGERWVAVSAGGRHTLGLTAAGTLHAWGDNRHGQCLVPTLPAGELWATVSAGFSHNLGLTVGGVLYAWGSNRSGECSGVPTPQGECWASVSAGDTHSLGLTVTGKVYAWGLDQYQKCSGAPTLAAGEHWVAVSAGSSHSLGITSEGALHAWGWGRWGQCSVPPGERWLAASAGGSHSLGVTSDGAVRAWGNDRYGQVSHIP